MDGVSIGPLFLRWNGLLIALGVSIGALIAALEARRRYHDTDIVYYLFMPLLLWGWIGARLWHVLTPPLSSVQLGLTTGHYLSHPLDILSFWIGGFGVPGAILGVTIALWINCRKDGLPFWDVADIFAPGFVIAHAIGRLGNYFNRELYGLPSKLPWAVSIPLENRLAGYEQVEFYHPLFAYEAIPLLGLAAVLIWLSRGRFADRLKPGELFLAYLGGYAVIRFLLEFLRLDVSLVNGVNANQAFFVVIFLLCAGILVRRRLTQIL